MIRVLPVDHAQLYHGTNKIPISLLLDLKNLEGETPFFISRTVLIPALTSS
jgi:hypothetical protein